MTDLQPLKSSNEIFKRPRRGRTALSLKSRRYGNIHPLPLIRDTSQLDAINADIIRFFENKVCDAVRTDVAEVIEDEMSRIVYKRDYDPVLKEINATFRHLIVMTNAKISTSIFGLIPSFPAETQKVMLREVRNRLNILLRSHLSLLRMVTLKRFTVWLIIEQERYKSLNCSKPPWYETDASDRRGLKQEIEGVYRPLIEELRGSLLKIEDAVAVHFGTERATELQQLSMAKDLDALALGPCPDTELIGDMMLCAV